MSRMQEAFTWEKDQKSWKFQSRLRNDGRGTIYQLGGLNSKEAEAPVVLYVLQEIQPGKSGCNHEWHNLGITHKNKNYADQQAELSLIYQDDIRLWVWYVPAYCQKVCYGLKEVKFACLCCSRRWWLQSPSEPVGLPVNANTNLPLPN